MDKLQKEAIAHYDRMIKWVKKQPKNFIPDESIMIQSIKEGWHTTNCKYCEINLFWNCPLANTLYNTCDGGWNCCGGLWVEMNNSKSWRKWLRYAKKVKQYIKDNG